MTLTHIMTSLAELIFFSDKKITCYNDTHRLSVRVVHVSRKDLARQGAAVTTVATVTVPVAIVSTVAGHCPVGRWQTVARQAVRQRIVAGKGIVAGKRIVTGKSIVTGQGIVAGHVSVTGALLLMRVPVTECVVAALLLFGDLLNGQETIFPHLYPLCHVPDGGVLCSKRIQFPGIRRYKV